jgi:hypothetical protein
MPDMIAGKRFGLIDQEHCMFSRKDAACQGRDCVEHSHESIDRAIQERGISCESQRRKISGRKVTPKDKDGGHRPPYVNTDPTLEL